MEEEPTGLNGYIACVSRGDGDVCGARCGDLQLCGRLSADEECCYLGRNVSLQNCYIAAILRTDSILRASSSICAAAPST